MERLKRIINNYIFKKRKIYSLKETEYIPLDEHGFYTEILSGKRLLNYMDLFVENNLDRKLIIKRSNNSNIYCLICFDKKGNAAGYFWGVVPKDNEIWHDSIPVYEGQGFLFNGYVSPRFRGKNIFSYMIHEMASYLTSEFKLREIIDVVEKVNIASIKAHKKVNAKIHSKNYLIKIMGRNIFTLFNSKIYYLNKKRKARI